MPQVEQVGVDYLLYVVTAVGPPEVLTPIGGEKDTSVEWEFDTIEVSNKTHGKVKLPGGGGFTLSLDGILMDEDVGADYLETLFFARTEVKVSIKKDTAIKYTGSGYLTKKSLKVPYEGGATFSYTLEGRGQMEPPA